MRSRSSLPFCAFLLALVLAGCASPAPPSRAPVTSDPAALAAPSGEHAFALPDPLAASSAAPDPAEQIVPEDEETLSEEDRAAVRGGESPEEFAYRIEKPAPLELYAGSPSVLAGEPLSLHVSARRSRFHLSLHRITATGSEVVWRSGWLEGRDYGELVRITPASGTVRARWPAAALIDTTALAAGVYIAMALSEAGERSRAVVVVRSPSIDPRRPLYVHSALTLAAYNRWGDWSFYRPRITTRLSLRRPLEGDDLGSFGRRDVALIRWLAGELPDLQYTTDYDLAIDPPAVHPRVLLLGSHTEYVGGAMTRWARAGLESGAMNIGIFGANSFYWRVRFAPSPEPGAPAEMICYKLFPGEDPERASDPTGRYRRLDDPEGAWLGSQYVGIVNGGRRAAEAVIEPGVDPVLLAGTGWSAGTLLSGYLSGETDAPYPAAPDLRSRFLARSADPSAVGLPEPGGSSYGENRAGGRVFVAGTFVFGLGLGPSPERFGVSPDSYARFARNVLRWLELSPATREADS